MLIALAVVLLLSLVLVGGDRGAKAVTTLAFNLVFLGCAVWLMSWGIPVLVVTMLVSVILSALILFFQNGNNVKTRSAFGASMLTMLLLFFAMSFVVWKGSAGGLNEIQTMGDMTLFYDLNLNLSMCLVQVAVIMLSTLGTVLDMALTVTTSIYEVRLHRPDLTEKEIRQSGIQMGSKIIGTTVNTLLFAYFGEMLILILYLRMRDYSLEMLLNSRMLFQNAVSMLFGAISCILVVPIASFISTKNLATG